MNIPLDSDLLSKLKQLDTRQLAFLAGYAWAQSENLSRREGVTEIAMPNVVDVSVAPKSRRITILSASQTGHAKQVATDLAQQLTDAGIMVKQFSAVDYKAKQLIDEDIVLLVTSTQGEGEPPEEAVPLYKFLSSKKAPDLSKLCFAVLGLGDSSYPKFCQAGKDFDERLSALGAKRLLELGLCDVSFEAEARVWIQKILALAKDWNNQPIPVSSNQDHQAVHRVASHVYTADNPFVATLSVRQKITARDAEKDVEHIEIDLSGSGIQYQVGDALGVWPINATHLVDEILSHSQLTGDEIVQLPDGVSHPLRHALLHHANITQNTPQFVQHYAQLSQHPTLQTLLTQQAELEAYLSNTPPVGVLATYPLALEAQTLFDLFRPQTPRLYSIASAQDEVGEEVHLTVGVQQFIYHNRHYTGAASGWLGSELAEGESIRVFVEPNPLFRLPENGNTPIIMIGAGTGIAPFRAFIQQREANGDTGDNWLIFGNRRFTDDFLYQTEWLQYRKSGLLTRVDLAWSRQGNQKIYVQHKLLQAADTVWEWLQKGAHVYVCGDAKRMAKDVETALLHIISTQGNMNHDDAEDYLNQMREDRRYQRDVY